MADTIRDCHFFFAKKLELELVINILKRKAPMLALLFIILGCENEVASQSKTLAILGTSAPEFSITTFDGLQLKLSDYKGYPVVINFWASWCAPCKREAHGLEETYQFFKNRKVMFIGIASDDTQKDALEFVKEYKVTYPNGMDEEEELSKKYSVLTLPITYIINRDGKIAFKKIGQIDEDTLKKEIRKVL